jgi:hypothetical protein
MKSLCFIKKSLFANQEIILLDHKVMKSLLLYQENIGLGSRNYCDCIMKSLCLIKKSLCVNQEVIVLDGKVMNSLMLYQKTFDLNHEIIVIVL